MLNLRHPLKTKSLRQPQLEAFNQSIETFKKHSAIFLDCVPRWGKTIGALYIALNAAKANIVIIFTGITTRSEWEEAANEFSGDIKLYFSNNDVKALDIKNLDPNFTHIIYCNLALEKRNEDVHSKLLAAPNIVDNVCYIYDEAHHAVGSDKTQKSLAMIKDSSKQVFLTGTSYTEFCKSFAKDQVYRFTYEDSWDYYRQGKSFKPIKLNMIIPSTIKSVLDKNKYDWLKLWQNAKSSECAISCIIKAIKETDSNIHNFLTVCNTQAECEELAKQMRKNKLCNPIVAHGDATYMKDGKEQTYDSETINNILKANPNTYNFVITCSKFCTGSTIRELQGVLFLCDTKSAIKFVQASFRCASPYPEEDPRIKTDGYIFCFESFTAFSILPRMYNNKDRIEKSKQFDKIKNDIEIKILDENNEFKSVNFVDVIAADDNFIKNRDTFKEHFKDKPELLDTLKNAFSWEIYVKKVFSIQSTPKGKSSQEAKTNNPHKKDLDDMVSPNAKEPKTEMQLIDKSSAALENYIYQSLIRVLETLTDRDLVSIDELNNEINLSEDRRFLVDMIFDQHKFPREAMLFLFENTFELCCKIIFTRQLKIKEGLD